MDRLPGGWVTFVFTDIEGSTRLFQQLGTAYRPALEDHRHLLRAAFGRHHGVEVGTEGDSFFVAFARAGDALAACLEAQLALASHPWPDEGPIRVRMGVHTGEAEPVDGDYVALAVHQAARVSATGHGGQIVLSDATRANAGGAVPAGARIVALGDYHLKDFDEPQPLFQLEHPGLPAEHPALKALPAAGHNLPRARTTFVGRDHDVGELAALVESNPLVTITGPGGVGKTRVALEVARQVIGEFRDGVWLVELAPLADPASVPSAVASTLGVREQPGRSLNETLVEALRSKRALVVMDNCEHLVGACAELADALLSDATSVALLATSRVPINTSGERVWSLAPLRESEAEQLFVARAQAVRRDFTATGETADAVRSICRALDRLPLAVELAAARASALSPAQILSKLETRLPLLAGGGRGTPDRHRTLTATIDWSYGLLEPGEHELFRSLSVFRGGCTLTAAERVAGAAVDGLHSLVEKSLLVSADGRFSMLATIREFALARLDAEPAAADELRRRHAEHFAEITPALGWLARDSDPEALDEIAAEHDNAASAFDWALEHGRLDLCERFIEGLWYHWVRRGLTVDGYRRADLALQRSPSPSAELISLTGELARFNGDLERAVQLKRDSLAAFEAGGARAGRIAADHTDLAETLVELGRLDEADRHATQGLVLRLEIGLPYGVAHAHAAIVQLELARGNHALAASAAELAMPAFRDARAWSDLAWACVRAATAYGRAGDAEPARSNLREALRHGVEIAEAAVTVAAVEQAAAVAARAGDDETALRLFGAARAGRSSAGYVFAIDDSALAISGGRVDPARRDALLEEGSRWDLDEAVSHARALLG